MKIITSVFAAGALMLAAVSPAFGQVIESYNKSAGQQQGQVQGGLGGANGPVQGADKGSPNDNATVSSDNPGSGLPFTGLDVALLLGAGGVLLAAGLGMRRLTRAPSSV